MDFMGFFLFGAVALLVFIYASVVIYVTVKRRPSRKYHLAIAGSLLLFLVLLGGWLYQIYFLNERLAIAAGEGDLAKVQLLLARGASPNSEGPDGVSTALIEAAWGGHTAIVELLLAKGADVNRRDSEGKRALDRAREEGHEEIVRMLIKAGAKE